MAWILLRPSNYKQVAPLVRTGGSRHTGLAALPHRNIQSGYFNTTIDFLVDGKAIEECNNLLQGLDETKRAKVLAIMKCVIENI